MKLIDYSKRGSTSVFLTMILASVLLAVSLFIYAASQAAARSYADAVFELAGRSILSEYDLELLKRYGIFAVHTDEAETEKKIKYYADFSFHDNLLNEVLRRRSYMDVLRLKLESVHVNLKGYSMTDTDLFEKQILAVSKFGIPGGDGPGKGNPQTQNEDIKLRNEQIINSLPSNGYRNSIFTDLKGIIENGIPSLAEITKEGTDNYSTNEYIMTRFLNHLRGYETRETFFSNEVEYILKGNFSDRQNYNAVRTDLFLVRNALNLVHIYSDPEKRNAVAAVATALTLATGEEIGIVIVSEAWAAAEAENDLRLLEDGQKVAFIKKNDNWAIPLSNTLDFLWKEDGIKPKKVTGYDYADYLRVLLFLEDREQKLLRCMDLIQLNMKGVSNRDFNLKEYYGGFQFEAVVKGRKFTYIQKY